MSTFSEKAFALRKLRGLTQQELADAINVSKPLISKYEHGIRSPKITIVNRYAVYFGVPLKFILDDSLPLTNNILAAPNFSNIPIIGTIACGTPILAEENITDYFAAPDFIHANFCLRCKGDSMIGARILDGDIAYIRIQDDVNDGDIAAVLIDDEATLKRVRHLPGGMIMLLAENPAYPPLFLGGEGETRVIRIIGKAVYFLSLIR